MAPKPKHCWRVLGPDPWVRAWAGLGLRWGMLMRPPGHSQKGKRKKKKEQRILSWSEPSVRETGTPRVSYSESTRGPTPCFVLFGFGAALGHTQALLLALRLGTILEVLRDHMSGGDGSWLSSGKASVLPAGLSLCTWGQDVGS